MVIYGYDSSSGGQTWYVYSRSIARSLVIQGCSTLGICSTGLERVPEPALEPGPEPEREQEPERELAW